MDHRKLAEAIWPDVKIIGMTGSDGAESFLQAVQKTGPSPGRTLTIRMIGIRADVPEISAEDKRRMRMTDDPPGRIRYYTKQLEKVRSAGNSPYIPLVEDFRILLAQSLQTYMICIRTEPFERIDYQSMDEKQIMKMGSDLCRVFEIYRELQIMDLRVHPRLVYMNRQGRYKLDCAGLFAEAFPSLLPSESFQAPESLPEEFDRKNRKAAEQTDVYALGLLMYWAANGCRMPFSAAKQIMTQKDREEAFARRISGEAVPPIEGISDDLNRLLQKACDYEPGGRYENVEKMRKAIERTADQPAGSS